MYDTVIPGEINVVSPYSKMPKSIHDSPTRHMEWDNSWQVTPYFTWHTAFNTYICIQYIFVPYPHAMHHVLFHMCHNHSPQGMLHSIYVIHLYGTMACLVKYNTTPFCGDALCMTCHTYLAEHRTFNICLTYKLYITCLIDYNTSLRNIVYFTQVCMPSMYDLPISHKEFRI